MKMQSKIHDDDEDDDCEMRKIQPCVEFLYFGYVG